MAAALDRIDAAAARREAFLISTANLNFLASSLADSQFRDSLLQSDLCTADGMPIVWVARLLGVPLKGRVAGSDMFAQLAARRPGRPLSVFLFGGPEGVADTACRALNARAGGLRCVGSKYPGYGSADELSGDATIDTINASGADFLAVALGAAKGQAWLLRNHRRLHVPVRVHLGAAIGFVAGAVRRAPRAIQRLGLEWLWRIKEEPYLWKRYGTDASVLLRLLLTRVLPLVAMAGRDRRSGRDAAWQLRIKSSRGSDRVTLALSGNAVAAHVDCAIASFREALAFKQALVILDLSDVRAIDARFLGLVLMLRKCARKQGAALRLVGVSPSTEKLLRLNEVAFLLSAEGSEPC
jgi:N-acetylglucosaminyldiphosphoundecaprenol N-acetyl-beta-D-mannosaminyltransferase